MIFSASKSTPGYVYAIKGEVDGLHQEIERLRKVIGDAAEAIERGYVRTRCRVLTSALVRGS